MLGGSKHGRTRGRGREGAHQSLAAGEVTVAKARERSSGGMEGDVVGFDGCSLARGW
jgi:hypothetical protein